jgi:hypothetical protein
MWQILGIIIFIIFLVFLTWLLQHKSNDYDEFDKNKWTARLQKIDKLLQESNDSAWRQAVIEADNVFDELLKHKGIGGATLGERLKIAQSRYKELRLVWPAHILRNKLVHETDVTISQRQASRAVADFRAAWRILGLNIK